MLRRFLSVAVLFLVSTVSGFALDLPVPAGIWQQGSALTTARSYATATLLNDGRVAVVGGQDTSSHALASVEFLLPDGTVAAGPSLSAARYGHSAALLGNGKLLVAGGRDASGTVLTSAELFDPTSNTWSTVAGTMSDPRADFTMSLLPSGDALLAGGNNGNGPVASIERFDQASASFVRMSALSVARQQHAAAVLPDGRILITGGQGVTASGSLAPLSWTEIYDPAANSVTSGPALNTARFAHSATALVDGTVLIAAGKNGSADLASLEIYDPATNTLTLSGAALGTARSGHTALLLPNNGHVLLAGGTAAGAALSSTELYRSWSSLVLPNASMSVARQASAASALQVGGTVAVVGGSTNPMTDFFGFATVKTDAADYPPGTPVHITGTGWQPGETITLSLVESPLYDTHPSMTAIADANGNIANSDFAPDSHDLNIRFYLTASGVKAQAYNTFTDSNPGSVVLSAQSPNPVSQSGQATYQASITFTGSSTCTVTLSIDTNTPLPAGATYGFSGPISGSSGSTGSATLTIKTGSTTPAGTTNFAIVSSTSGTCAGQAPKGSGTLVVESKGTFSNLVVPASATYGQSTLTVTGKIADETGTAFPAGSTVQVSINGTTVSATPTVGSDGTFTANLGISSLPVSGSPYTVTFAFAGNSTFAAATPQSKNFTLNAALPSITWTNPTAITYGTALSSTQLNATASYSNNGSQTTVPGTFTYTPASGSVLSAGSQTLSVHFVPTDGVDFATPSDKTVTLTVNALSVTPSIAAQNKTYDGTNAATFSCTLAGVLAADSASVSCTGGSATFASANAGTGQTVTATGLQLSGSKASNYVLSSTTATTTANITPKALTLTGVTANSKVYDGSNTATLNTATAALSGVLPADIGKVSIDASGASATFPDKKAGTARAITVLGFKLAGTAAANYSLAQPTGLTADITPKALTVSGITAADKTYDRTTSATLNTGSAALVGLVSGDSVALSTTAAMGAFADKNAAPNKTVSVSGLTVSGADASNYTLTQPTATATINPKALTVAGITAADKTYDRTTSATLNTASAALVGVISGDTVLMSTASATGAFGDWNAAAGKTVTISGVSISGADATNYSLTQPTATATINPKGLTVSGATAADKTYDGNQTATLNTASAALVGVISGDTVTLSTSSAVGSFGSKTAAANKTVTISGLKIAGTDAGNYTLTQPTATATISPKALTVSAITAVDKTYDGTTSAALNVASAALVGVVSGDEVALSTSAASGSFANKTVGTAKTVTITGLTISGADSTNYTLTQPTATATINAKTLVVSGLTAADKTYDGTDSATLNTASSVLAGLITNDDVVLNTAAAVGHFPSKNVGNHLVVTISGLTISGGDALNYTLTQPGATATINAKTLTVTGITAVDKTYDGNASATLNTASAALVGVVGSDAVTVNVSSALGQFPDKNVGENRTVTISGLVLAGGDAGNYTVAQPTATATIIAKTLTVTGVTAADKTYDGNRGATLNTASAALNGVVSPDNVVLNVAAAVGQFGDKTVGANKAVTITGISITGTGIGNYILTQPPATASILAKGLTVTGITAADKTYDGNTTATLNTAGAALVGVVSGDAVALSTTSATGAFADKAAGTGKTVTIAGLSISGADFGNYTLTQPTATATIHQKGLTVTGVSAADKIYDGSNSATLNTAGAALSGVVSPDAVMLNTSAATGVFPSKNVGSGLAVTITGFAISGTDAPNYTLTQPSTSASITQKTLTVSGAIAQDKVYDGNAIATLNFSAAGLQGVVSGDTVTLSTGSASGTFLDKNVGMSKTVTVSNLAPAGTDAGNYSLTAPVLSASITPKPLTVLGVTASNKIYDGNTSATPNFTAAALSGIISGDNVSLVTGAATASFADSNAGNNKVVTIAGLNVSGTDSGNYSLAQPATTATITPKTLTVAGVTANNKVYDRTTAVMLNLGSAALQGIVGSDPVGIVTSAAVGVFSDAKVGTAKPVSISGITLNGTAAANYYVTQPAATADITQKPVSANITVSNKIYDGTASATIFSESLTGVISPDDVTLAPGSGMFADKLVGTGKSVSITGLSLSGADAANYNVSGTATVKADITPRTLHVAASGVSKTYDGNTTAVVTLSDDRVSGDAFSDAYASAAFGDKNVGTAKPISVTGISVSGGDSGNYMLASTTAATAADITARTLTVSMTADSKQYDGNASATVHFSDNRLAGDNFTTSSVPAAFDSKKVGTGKTVTASGITVSTGDAGNYILTSTTATALANITARPLTVTAAGVNRTYDGTDTATVTLSDNRLTGDDVVDHYASAAFDNKNAGTGKTVTVLGLTITGNDAGNYSANTTTQITADISARVLTVTAVADSKVYDATTSSAGSPTIGQPGVAPGDSGSFGQTFDTKIVGSGKKLTPAGSIQDGNNGANYQINFVPVLTGVITQRPLTIAASAANKVYDGNTAATVSLSDDHLSGDVVADSDTTPIFSDKNIGISKTVTVSGLGISGTDAANYQLTSSTATTQASITARMLTVTATGVDKTYDGSATATATLADDHVSGDTVTDAYTSASFADRNAGSAKTVSVSGISISGADAGNYNLANTTATTSANIAALAIDVTATTDTKVYDGTTASVKLPTLTSAALVQADTASTLNQAFDSKNAGSRTLNPTLIINDGNGGKNYVITTHSAAGSITPLAITATITAADKVYDGTTSATLTSGSLTGVLASDQSAVSLAYLTAQASFAQSNAGTNLTVTALNLSLQGSAAPNYSISSTATTTATISRANQTITWNAPTTPFIYGTALSSTQLNATAAGVSGGSAPGALTYTPAAGTVPGPGQNTLSVTAAATVNYNSATKTVPLTVTYSTSACLGELSHNILQPINADGSSTFKQGSTVPAKFRVCDASGHSIGTAGVVTSFNLVGIMHGTVTATVDETVVSTNPDSTFRWDSTAQQWIFNISTKPLATQSTYIYSVGLNDGTTIMFQYGLPK